MSLQSIMGIDKPGIVASVRRFRHVRKSDRDSGRSVCRRRTSRDGAGEGTEDGEVARDALTAGIAEAQAYLTRCQQKEGQLLFLVLPAIFRPHVAAGKFPGDPRPCPRVRGVPARRGRSGRNPVTPAL